MKGMCKSNRKVQSLNKSPSQKVMKRELDTSHESPPKKSKTNNMDAFKAAGIQRLQSHIGRAKDCCAPKADIQKCHNMMGIAIGLLEKVCDEPNNHKALLRLSNAETELQMFVDGLEPSAEDCDGPEEEYPLYSDDEL